MIARDSRPPAPATEPAGAPEGRDTGSSGSAVQGTAERQALANVIHDGACQCRGHGFGTVGAMVADQIADAVLAAGYVRVVEDDDTVERVAKVLAKADDWWPWDQPADVDEDVAVTEDIKDGFRRMARAALQALRGDKVICKYGECNGRNCIDCIEDSQDLRGDTPWLTE